MELPKSEKQFYFNHTGESGFLYEGNFTVKCRLNVAERMKQESDYSRLLGDAINPSQGLRGFALCVSTCRSHIIDSPEWFKQSRGLLEDEDALIELHSKVVDIIDSWRLELAEAAKAKEVGK
jgi:hypothetical protein